MEDIKKVPMYFHIGRNRNNNKAGYITFMGIKPFHEVVNLCIQYGAFWNDRDERGRFCKPYLSDCNGNRLTDCDLKGEYGMVETDTIYDSDIVIPLKEVIGWPAYEEALRRAYKDDCRFGGNTISDDILQYLIDNGVTEP